MTAIPRRFPHPYTHLLDILTRLTYRAFVASPLLAVRAIPSANQLGVPLHVACSLAYLRFPYPSTLSTTLYQDGGYFNSPAPVHFNSEYLPQKP
jgi:hypothetical protein